MDGVRTAIDDDPGGGIYQYKRPGGGTLPARWHEQNRWRPNQDLPDVPPVQNDRTKRAVVEQCMNARMPGYSGYVPCARAEDICFRSQASVGRTARDEQVRRHEQRSSSQPSRAPALTFKISQGEGSQALKDSRRSFGFDLSKMPDDHPLGKSKSTIVRNHWIPTIPGYAGYIPGVHPENISGGTMSRQCRDAARALAEQPSRGKPLKDEPHPDEALAGSVVRGFKDKDEFERSSLIDHLRGHCSGHIPGYMGYIPRVHSESIFGGTAAATGSIAAMMNEDRVSYPSDEGKRCHAVQVPDKRKLRM